MHTLPIVSDPIFCLNYRKRLSVQREISALGDQAKRGQEIQIEICEIEKDRDFLDDSKLKHLEDRISSIRKAFSESASKDQVINWPDFTK